MFGTRNIISLSVPHATWHDSTSRELTESLLLGRRLEMSALPWAMAPDSQGLDNEWVESGVECGCDGVKEWGWEGEASQCQREQSCEQVKRWFGWRRWNFSSHTVKWTEYREQVHEHNHSKRCWQSNNNTTERQSNTTQLAQNSHFSKKNWLPRVGLEPTTISFPGDALTN